MDFLKNNRRFSMRYDGKDLSSYDVAVKVREEGSVIVTEYVLNNTVKITNTAKKYTDFGAYEWSNELENIADTPSGIISDLYDCDCSFAFEHEEPPKWCAYLPDERHATKVYAPNGSTWSDTEFYCDVDAFHDHKRVNHIVPGEKKCYATSGGRSSQEMAPFFNVSKNDSGIIFAIGWTGQWNCEIERGTDEVRVRTKIEDTHFRLLPGEKIKTSSVVILPYKDKNPHNIWRRLLREHFSPVGTEGRDAFAPLCAGIWGGMRAEAVLDRIEKISKNNLPFEYVWMDAGWYGIDTKPTPDEFEGDWGLIPGTGV